MKLEIVENIEKELNDEEKLEYRRQSEQYASMSSLISNPNTQLKRSSMKRQSGTHDMSESGGASYLMMAVIDNPKNSQVKLQEKPTSNTFTDSISENDHDSKARNMLPKPEIIDSGNKAVNKCDYVSLGITTPETIEYENLDSDKSDAINVSLIQPNLCKIPPLHHGYITVQAANES